MSLAGNQSSGGLEKLAELEATLLGRIAEASSVLSRSDSLDEEQRAEIHAILEALRHDCESRTAIMRSLPTETCHA